MRKHVFLAVLLCALAAPSLSHAGEVQQQWQEKKDSWRSQWQEQQGGGKAAAAAAALKEKYGQISAGDAQALRERMKQAKDKYLSPEQRSERWEVFKAAHPDLLANMKGGDLERRQQWEEWQNEHKETSDKWSEKTEAAREKWKEFKQSQEGHSDRARDSNWKDFKFHNRDEGLAAKAKYDEWARQHQGAADSLKARAQAWKASH